MSRPVPHGEAPAKCAQHLREEQQVRKHSHRSCWIHSAALCSFGAYNSSSEIAYFSCWPWREQGNMQFKIVLFLSATCLIFLVVKRDMQISSNNTDEWSHLKCNKIPDPKLWLKHQMDQIPLCPMHLLAFTVCKYFKTGIQLPCKLLLKWYRWTCNVCFLWRISGTQNYLVYWTYHLCKVCDP